MSVSASRAERLAEEAAALDAEAREHKRQERHHRRAAVRARAKLGEIQAACDEYGIKLVLGDDDHTEPEEVHSGGQDSRTQRSHS